jgi:hypothetical protein
MFGIVGRIVIYGFCLYGMRRMFEKLHISDAEEDSFVNPQQNEQPLSVKRSTSVTAQPSARTDWPRSVSPIG